MLTFKEIRLKTFFLGNLTGTAILFVTAVFPVLLFGTAFAARQDFPFATAVSTVSVGRLYSRLDGFYYFFVFAAAIIRAATAIFTSLMSLRFIKKLYEQNSV